MALRDVVLAISRLTDPVKSGTFDNLSIGALLLDPAIDQHDGLRGDLERAIDAAETAAAPIRPHRNKYIAHLDHATAIGSEDSPLPNVKRSQVAEALGTLEDAYNVHGLRVHQSQMIFEMVPLGGSDSLIDALESSDRWRLWMRMKQQRAAASDAPEQPG